MIMSEASLREIQDYYGKVLRTSNDLRTDACTTIAAPPAAVRRALSNVHPEVSARYFGCGLVAPQALDGCRVLDLGSGSGRDAYVLAQLVGQRGAIIGVDATPEQLAVARTHEEWHRRRFAFDRSNVTFIEGDIARLAELDLTPRSFDVVVSNCVINLVEDKASVLTAVERLLKPGGEFYFSDVYADRRVDPNAWRDPVLRGECLAGALYWGDFLAIAKSSGFLDPRLVADRPLSIADAEIAAKLEPARFFSATWRLFKLGELEPACEDYGQAVQYNGGILGSEAAFALDKHHQIEAGRVFPVCGNTWRMLSETRFAPYFRFYGDFDRHYGVFAGCGTSLPFDEGAQAVDGSCC